MGAQRANGGAEIVEDAHGAGYAAPFDQANETFS